MTKPLSVCTGCSLYGATVCPSHESPVSGNCDSFLSWSDQLRRESVAIEKAQRVAWALLLLTSILAFLVVLMPEVGA